MSCVTRFTFLKGTTAQRLGLVLLEGELLYDTTEKSWYGGDGVNAGGRPLSNLTDEQIQDALAVFLQDSTTVDVIYDDGLNKMTLEVIQTALNHANFQNIGTNTHAQIDSHIASTANPHNVTKAQVGLGNVDNTSDVNKPVSTAQATAIAVVQSDIDAHEARTDNPHSTTKAQVGLGNVDNTSDANKPVSTAQQTALNLKADKAITITGTGSLTGGGDLSANRTIDIADIVTGSTAGTSLQIPVFTFNNKGQITGNTNTQIPNATQSISGLMSAADKIKSDKFQVIRKTADQTFNGNGLTGVTDLNFAAVNGRSYLVEVYLRFSSSATGNGVQVTVQVPAGTISGIVETPQAGDGTASFTQGNITASLDVVQSTGVPAANTNYLSVMKFIYNCTADGTVIVGFANENLLIDSSVVRANSVMLVQEIT
jgi:hypothetical protein